MSQFLGKVSVDCGAVALFFLVSYVGERPWWPIQGLNKGRKKNAKG